MSFQRAEDVQGCLWRFLSTADVRCARQFLLKPSSSSSPLKICYWSWSEEKTTQFRLNSHQDGSLNCLWFELEEDSASSAPQGVQQTYVWHGNWSFLYAIPGNGFFVRWKSFSGKQGEEKQKPIYHPTRYLIFVEISVLVLLLRVVAVLKLRLKQVESSGGVGTGTKSSHLLINKFWVKIKILRCFQPQSHPFSFLLQFPTNLQMNQIVWKRIWNPREHIVSNWLNGVSRTGEKLLSVSHYCKKKIPTQHVHFIAHHWM